MLHSTLLYSTALSWPFCRSSHKDFWLSNPFTLANLLPMISVRQQRWLDASISSSTWILQSHLWLWCFCQLLHSSLAVNFDFNAPLLAPTSILQSHLWLYWFNLISNSCTVCQYVSMSVWQYDSMTVWQYDSDPSSHHQMKWLSVIFFIIIFDACVPLNFNFDACFLLLS